MHSDAKRKERLGALLALLKQGRDVQNRDLRTWLGNDAYADYESDWVTQQALREELRKKPTVVREYERLLKRATFLYNKADAASRRGRHNAARKGFASADSAFERLYEHLHEIVTHDPTLAGWFDRDGRSATSPTPDDAPRVVTSLSMRNAGGGIAAGKLTKKQVKIAAIEHELQRMERGDEKGLLDQALARLKKFTQAG